MKPNNRIQLLSKTAFIAALYTVITWLCSLVGLSSGVIQVRLSEALIIMTAFTPAAIPGMTLGCLISNLITGALPMDVLFGTLASLIGALGGYLLRRYPILIPLPTIVSNAAIIPFVLRYTYGAPDALPFLIATVAIGEILSAGVAGLLLCSVLKKYKRHLR